VSPAAFVTAEIASQPETWRRAAALAAERPDAAPAAGQRVAVVGCGSSWFVAQSWAAFREEAGQGPTDAFAASEFPAARREGYYDLVVAITRSGTTTEVLDLLAALPAAQRTMTVVGDPTSPVAARGDIRVQLDFADERSVVQTRFATAALVFLRALLGEDLQPVIAQGENALAADVPADWLTRQQFVFLGRGPAVGLAHEAALKMRESALAWAESYPAMDYRHGPIALAEPHSLVWVLGEPPAGLADQIATTGATVQISAGDPVAALVHVQRLAVALATSRGLDPDVPRNLTRSIVLG
jgi:fructoselysine-6-P-deglycase FrlB-like protein